MNRYDDDTQDEFPRWPVGNPDRPLSCTAHDERRGRDANLAGKPFNPAENIDWQRGWEIAQADRRLEEWE